MASAATDLSPVESFGMNLTAAAAVEHLLKQNT